MWLGCVLCILTVCGCSADVSTLQGTSFATVLKSAGFTVTKDREAANSDKYVDDVEIAVKDDKYQIEMYFITNESKATKYFADFCKTFNKKTKTATSTNVSGEHYGYYSMNDGDTVYRIVRYESKILVVSANKKYESDISKIIDKLGEIYNVKVTS